MEGSRPNGFAGARNDPVRVVNLFRSFTLDKKVLISQDHLAAKSCSCFCSISGVHTPFSL
jgi:hypothetical protein